MRHSTVLLSFFAYLAFSQTTKNATTTLEFWSPGGRDNEGDALNAEILTANADTTVMTLPCPTTDVEEAEACKDFGDVTYSIISTTVYQWHQTGESNKVDFTCTDNKSKKEAVCTITQGDMKDFTATQVLTLNGTDSAMATATITKGADLLEKAQKGAGFKLGVEGYAMFVLAGAAVLNAL